MIIASVTGNRAIAQFIPAKWEAGINLGALVYQGDLSTSFVGYTRSPKPSVEAWVSKSIDNYFSLRANLLLGELGADESTYSTPEWRRHRNFAFSSSLTELSAELVWDLYGKTYREGMRRFSPYFFAGAGIAILHIKRDWSRLDTSYFNSKSSASIGLGIDSLHNPSRIVAVLPVGAGLRYMLTNHIFLNAEATYRITASDYIDGFKYSGDPTRNDHFYGLTLGVSWRFGGNLADCPKVQL
jgi:opacity protein-like surface antigen